MKYLFLVGGILLTGLGFLLVLGIMLVGGVPEETVLGILMVVGGLFLLYKGAKKKKIWNYFLGRMRNSNWLGS